jgi:hypothetical protein
MRMNPAQALVSLVLFSVFLPDSRTGTRHDLSDTILRGFYTSATSCDNIFEKTSQHQHRHQR